MTTSHPEKAWNVFPQTPDEPVMSEIYEANQSAGKYQKLVCFWDGCRVAAFSTFEMVRK